MLDEAGRVASPRFVAARNTERARLCYLWSGVKVEVLMSPGCGHGEKALALVTSVVRDHAPGTEVATVIVATDDDAARFAFPGSPTVRVNGIDIDPDAPRNVGLG